MCTIILAIVSLIILKKYANKLAARIQFPLDSFLFLFANITAEDLLLSDLADAGGSGIIENVEDLLTSKDMRTVYESFISLFHTVRYSNLDYYHSNYG